ncbi:unnamed protein product [Orchesella dallaii]|uniref:Peptidase S1 domain-containing protein n=1 Tax=Orchesella dallaii TaxID=48710 RepID=A0ABP1RA63_9HEXA
MIVCILSLGSYKISPKPCSVKSPSSSSAELQGTCMFVWECLKSEGKHLGMCVDGFMFGSCCSHDFNENAIEGSSISTLQNVHENDVVEVIGGITSSVPFTPVDTTPIVIEDTTTPFDSQEDVIGIPFITRRNITMPTTTSTSTTTTTTSTTTTTTSTTTTTPSPPPPPTSSIPPPRSSPPGSTPVLSTSESTTHTCGISVLHRSPSPQKRIVGGTEAKYGQFPWQVSVRRTSFFGFSSTHRCGGALINEQWVATAGHCVDDLMTSQIKIRLGEFDFSNTKESHAHQEKGIKKKIVHPSYNFFTYENDLALLKLETPVNLTATPHIVPICLPGSDDLLIGENATVTGWGRLSEGGQLPNTLQYVQVPIISNDKCRDMFLKSGRMEHIPEIFLCAGYDNGGRDSCQGDSGGPLQVVGSDKRYFLAGIISWGIGCAEPNMPGVCTRISKFTSWILNHVRNS